MQLKFFLFLNFYVQYGLASYLFPSTLGAFKIKALNPIKKDIINKLEDTNNHDFIPLVAGNLLSDFKDETIFNLYLMYKNVRFFC